MKPDMKVGNKELIFPVMRDHTPPAGIANGQNLF
jgi:hypothetical protein